MQFEAWIFLTVFCFALIFLDGHNQYAHLKVGLWCLAGLLGFLILEKLFVEEDKDEQEEKSSSSEEERTKNKNQVLIPIVEVEVAIYISGLSRSEIEARDQKLA